ncbi:MAG: hypothetical protein Q8N91_06825 [Candidatus Omnitrophota bacterium]|nr:hypothetical protein [Candidatus Omnitrophota bacterium]
MPTKYHLSLILLIIALTLLVYYDSFNNSFVYDDYPFLVENPAVRILTLRGIISNFIDRAAASSSERLSKDVWRPFVTTSFAIDYRLWGLKPRFYHIENTAFHTMNAILVYCITFLILKDALAAFIASLVFAIHPAETEAVTWVSGRSNVLFLLFFLLAFIFHIRDTGYKKSVLNRALSLVFFAFSLFSKEMAIALPLVLILYDAHFHGRRSLKTYVNNYLPFFLVGAFYLIARFSVLGTIAQKEEWWGGGIFANILVTLKAVAEYIRILLFPVNLKIMYLVDAPKSLFERDILAALFIIFLAIFFYLANMRRKEASFYILWFFITLIPVSNIVPFKAVMAERFLYLPMIGFASCFGMIFSNAGSNPRLGTMSRAVLNFIFIAILIFYGAATISRNCEWRDEITFYAQESIRSPKDPTAHYNLAFAYGKEAHRYADREEGIADAYYGLAIKEYKEALSLKPDSQLAYAGLGNVYNELGFYDDGIKNFRKASAIKEDSDIYNNMAVSYYRKGIFDETIKFCKKALYLKPGHANAYINMGNAFYAKKEYGKAKLAWLEAGSGISGADLLTDKRMKEAV